MSFVLKSSTVKANNVQGDTVSCKSLKTNSIASGNVTAPSVVLTESASQVAPGSGKGRLWVRDDSPSVLVFTDDAGTDVELGAAAGGGYSESESIAIGQGATVASLGSISIGAISDALVLSNPELGTNATGLGAIAIGSGNNAGYAYARTSANGDGAIAIGGGNYNGAQATGEGAIAIGGGGDDDGATTLASGGISIGVGSFSNMNSISLGRDSGSNSSINSVSIGYSAVSLGSQSIAIGSSSRVNATHSIALGRYAYTNTNNTLAINLSGGNMSNPGSISTNLVEQNSANVQTVGTNAYINVLIGGVARKLRVFS